MTYAMRGNTYWYPTTSRPPIPMIPPCQLPTRVSLRKVGQAGRVHIGGRSIRFVLTTQLSTKLGGLITEPATPSNLAFRMEHGRRVEEPPKNTPLRTIQNQSYRNHPKNSKESSPNHSRVDRPRLGLQQ